MIPDEIRKRYSWVQGALEGTLAAGAIDCDAVRFLLQEGRDPEDPDAEPFCRRAEVGEV